MTQTITPCYRAQRYSTPQSAGSVNQPEKTVELRTDAQNGVSPVNEEPAFLETVAFIGPLLTGLYPLN